MNTIEKTTGQVSKIKAYSLYYGCFNRVLIQMIFWRVRKSVEKKPLQLFLQKKKKKKKESHHATKEHIVVATLLHSILEDK